ncbi:MAG: adenylate/guanylate cyclase domain-containing protein [Bacteroidales bacterium]|nr:adenylate/guanylate cyclase domain-containing protein [Bacteroidales bacterium]MDD3891209.1 adenylate/guanylate cyclase domain-containing protein [Bacteroidales bacterium]
MNFIKFLFIQLLIFFRLTIITVLAQGFICLHECPAAPLVHSITSLPNSFHETYTDFAQLGKNLLLVKGDKNTYLFDGFNWDTIALAKDYELITDDTDGVYIVSKKSVLKLYAQSDGNVYTQHLIDSSSVHYTGDIETFCPTDINQYFFTTKTGLWLQSNTLTHIDATEKNCKLLNTQSNTIYLKDGEGAFYVNPKNTTITPIDNTRHININNVIATANINDELVFITNTSPFIHWANPNYWINKQRNIKILPKNIRIKKAYSKNNYLLLLTEPEGFIVVDGKGDIVLQLSGSLSSVEIDKISDLIALPNGETLLLTKTSILHCTNTKHAGVFLGINNLSDTPQSLLYANNNIYVTTNNSLYTAKLSASKIEKTNFKKVKDIQLPISSIVKYKSTIYLSDGDRVFKLKNHDLQEVNIPNAISNEYNQSLASIKDEVWAISIVENNLVGLCLTNRSNQEIKIPLTVDYINITAIEFYKNFILIQQDNDKWFYTLVDDRKNEWAEINLDHANQKIIFNIPRSSVPIVITKETINEFDLAHNSLGKILIKEPIDHIAPIFINDSTLITKTQSRSFTNIYSIWLYHFSPSDSCYKPSKALASLLSGTIIYNAVYTPDSTLILATNNGLLYFTNTIKDIEPIVNIQQVKLSSDKNEQIIKNRYLSEQEYRHNDITPEYNYRSLSASFSGMSSNNWSFGLNNIHFSSKLSGIDKDWLPWTKNNSREISRLSPGEYILSVRTQNYLGQISQPASICFSIKPTFFETNYFIATITFFLLIGLYSLYRWRVYYHAKVRFKLEKLINTRTEELVKEKEKADNLIARVLPRDTASELKEKGRVTTQRFQMVTVLFSDIEGFTRITEETNPEILIDQLDRFFLYFDSVVEKYRIEKIKTIGDAYMCAGGLPQKNRTNPVEVVLAALEMMSYMRDINKQNSDYLSVWELRIGIDTGPVIAGVVGRNKLSYDIWGSTVNIASRMESSGEPGQINISGNTFMLVNEYFSCPFRGRMPIKNRGDVDMYFVNGIKPDLSVNNLGIKPNHKFKVYVQLVRLGDLEEFIFDKLEKGLPTNLYYHNLKHTVDVYTQVELIGRAEGVDHEEMLLLRTAALFHDAGHLIDYDTHEEMAVKLAREILPEYQYSDEQINLISELIMSTKLPPQPKSLLEEIMCDADLDYLGRTDFIPVSDTLYKELHEHGKVGTLREWNYIQTQFIEKHSYFTKTARKLRNVNKRSQLDKLKEWLEKN